ncbi:TPA: glycosyl transferase, partial [Escherichia coli]|nr:glycosyl transferase [Escherichia coli]
VITDNQAISDYVLEEYGNTSSVIAYGGDHSLITSAVNLPKYSAPFYLTICRIEPENNIHIILEAFSQTNHNLKLIGNWHSSIYGKELFEKYSRFSNIELIHPIYELEKLYVLRETCCGYIHGHSAGGTNPSLVEAMHFSKPVYAYDCIFNRFTTENGAFYFCNSQQLIRLLNDDSLNTCKNAQLMKQIAMSRYTWKTITSQYEELY